MTKHNPKQLSRILSSFTENNNIIKYTTHDWDFGCGERTFNTIEEFTEQVKKEWLNHSAIINQLRPSLVEKYEAFLFDKNHTKWGVWEAEFGWSSEEMKEEEENQLQFQYIEASLKWLDLHSSFANFQTRNSTSKYGSGV